MEDKESSEEARVEELFQSRYGMDVGGRRAYTASRLVEGGQAAGRVEASMEARASRRQHPARFSMAHQLCVLFTVS